QALSDVYGDYSYFLLDEIQNLPNWELWISKLYRRGINLIITGSNSKLLSKEIASSLTGRYLQLNVLPFSFAESIRFLEQTVSREEITSPTEIGKTLALFQTYLFNGGFPEVLRNSSLLRNYLSSLFDSILLKDILKRFRIRQTQQLYDLSNYLLSNYTNLFSFNQLKDALDFNSVATVQKFVSYLEEPYLFQHITRYSNKVKNQNKAAQKIYIIDNGFVQARSFELSPNFGRLLENLVFIELIRRNYKPELDLFYYRTRNDREIDFLIRKGHQIEQLIQVCYDISASKAFKREVDALVESADELNCTNLLLLTWDMEDNIEIGNHSIRVLPVYKWLLRVKEI
ncbi:MAG: ATP-binding protein, partial [Candidatus Delongbacteria bacterium]|nr:ATP-binding protein [Candidatus Delongbacteria bacterium]